MGIRDTKDLLIDYGRAWEITSNYFKKKSPLSKYDKDFDKIKDFYNPLYVTGPGLLSEIVPLDLPFTTHYYHPDTIKLNTNNTIILIGYKGYREWLENYYKKNKLDSYQTAWRKKMLFK